MMESGVILVKGLLGSRAAELQRGWFPAEPALMYERSADENTGKHISDWPEIPRNPSHPSP